MNEQLETVTVRFYPSQIKLLKQLARAVSYNLEDDVTVAELIREAVDSTYLFTGTAEQSHSQEIIVTEYFGKKKASNRESEINTGNQVLSNKPKPIRRAVHGDDPIFHPDAEHIDLSQPLDEYEQEEKYIMNSIAQETGIGSLMSDDETQTPRPRTLSQHTD